MSTPAPAPQKTEKGTGYVILTFDTESDNWFEAGDRVKATSANAAIRQHAQTYPQDAPASYVAIPTRSFKPVKVTVETTKTVKLG